MTFECSQCSEHYTEPLPAKCLRCGGPIMAGIVRERGDAALSATRDLFPPKPAAKTQEKKMAAQKPQAPPPPARELMPEPIAALNAMYTSVLRELSIAAESLARATAAMRGESASRPPKPFRNAAGPSPLAAADSFAAKHETCGRKPRASKHRAAILAALAAAPSGLRTTDLAAPCGCPGKPQNIHGALGVMAARGEIVRERDLWKSAQKVQ